MKRRIPFFCRLVVLQLLSVFLFIGCGSDNSFDFSTSEQVGVRNGEPTPENGEVNNGDDGDNGAGGGAGESEGEDNGGTIGVNSRAVFEFEYDRISQLVGVSLGGKPLASYSFDPAGNLTNLTLNGLEKEFSYNTLNQVTEASFDSKGQTTAQSSEGRTFEWNEQGQVTAIIQGNRRTELGYDGSARRTTITEIIDGGVESKKHYSWLGGRLMCERDGLKTGFPITKRYLGQGLIVTPEGEGEPGAVTTKLYYLTDHLGSVVQVVDDKDQTRAEYRYSIYGERVKVSGDLDIDFGFAGLFHHEPSGLDLATYRLYDPEQRRFISRDPLGEAVDYNLYRYANNNPVNFVDPMGLQVECPEEEFDRQKLLDEALDKTFSLDTLLKLGYSFLEAIQLLDARGTVVDAAIDAAAGEGGGGTFDPLLKVGTKRGRKRAAGKALKEMSMPSHLTKSEKSARKSLGLSKGEFGDRIHSIKDDIPGNPDVYFDPVTGDVFDRRSLENIGNLLDDY